MFDWLEKFLPNSGKAGNALEKKDPSPTHTRTNIASFTTSIMADARARRIKGAGSHTTASFLPIESSPLLSKILQGMVHLMPGFTYVLCSKSGNGKTEALLDLMTNHSTMQQSHNRTCGALHLACSRDGTDSEDCLRKQLDTTLEQSEIVTYLMAAMGAKGIQGGITNPPALLIVDEVNREGVRNDAFIKSLFLRNHEAGVIGISATSRKDLANHYIAMNQGKIRPYPGFANDDWQPKTVPHWQDVNWSIDDLDALLKLLCGEKYDDLDTSFLKDGMTPGFAKGRAPMQISGP